MRSLKLVIVSPKYQINMGYIARTASNFGIKKLYLVNPRCNYSGQTALKYAKHGMHLLKSAKILKSVSEVKKGSLMVGTTGVHSKSGSAAGNIYKLDDAVGLIAKNKGDVALLIGREDTGLTLGELRECDIIAFIPADDKYPVLNISHAIAIMLYSLTKEKGNASYDFSPGYASAEDKGRLADLFDRFIAARGDIKNKKGVSGAFRRLLMKSTPTKTELNSIAVAISPNKIKKEKR
jgi:tRNA/rRNA methyltransferase